MAQTIPYRNSWAVGQSMDGPGRRGSIAAGDFNDDGRLDFVVRGIEDVNNTTSPAIYYQQPDGSFSPVGVTFLSTSNDLHYRVVDFNKDGKDDIVESGGSHNLTIFIQGSNGSFTALDAYLTFQVLVMLSMISMKMVQMIFSLLVGQQGCSIKILMGHLYSRQILSITLLIVVFRLQVLDQET